MRHAVIVLLVVALTAGGCSGVRDLNGSVDSDWSDPAREMAHEGPSAPPPPTTSPAEPTPLPSDEHAVRIEIGDDMQGVVDDSPPGSTFVVASGVHRNQKVVPKSGDTFIGESGAVMSGATRITDWRESGERWISDGHTAEGAVFGEVHDGYERDRHPEDLWIDNRLLRHRPTPEVGKGEWHFDYEADRIYIGEDPVQAVVELAVTPWAFSGQASDVTLVNLIVERYASTFQHGAVGGGPLQGGKHEHRRWTLRNMELRQNHGLGARLSSGTVLEHSKLHHNGDMGLGISGQHANGNDYDEPVTIRYNEFSYNTTLGFDTQVEGGGLKIAYTTAGSMFEHNWSHHNRGPGIWYDIDNRDAIIRGNRVERNLEQGIFYEISFGPSVIEDNLVLHNGGHGVYISTSQDVEIRGNVIAGNGRDALQIRDADRGGSAQLGPYAGRDVLVVHNDITTDDGTIGYQLLSGRGNLLDPKQSGVRFTNNHYRAGTNMAFAWGVSDGEDPPTMSFEQWQRDLGMDNDGAFTRLGNTTAAEVPVPEDAPQFQPAHYGPQ